MYDSRAKTPEETIEVRVNSVTFRSPTSTFAILSADRLDRREALTVVGPLREYQKGDKLKLVGRFEVHSRYGTQLRVSLAHPIAPQDQESIREYLINAKVRGFGVKRVEQLIERFGLETLDVIVNHPERLKELGGLGDKRIDNLREVVRAQTGRQETMIFLYDLQLSAAIAARVWAQYQERSREVIEDNPYRLISEIDFFDFQLAERIARHLHWDMSRIERVLAGLICVLMRAQDEGHVCLPRLVLLNHTAQFLGSPARCEESLERALREGQLNMFEERVSLWDHEASAPVNELGESSRAEDGAEDGADDHAAHDSESDAESDAESDTESDSKDHAAHDSERDSKDHAAHDSERDSEDHTAHDSERDSEDHTARDSERDSESDSRDRAERDAQRARAPHTSRTEPYIYLAELGDLEREAAREVKRIMRQRLPRLDYDITALQEESDLTLAEAQREAIKVASTSPLLLLTGGPGTGKTTTVRALISLFDGHELTVKLAAPTGRAARRLSETTGCDALTIHRLLDYQPQEEVFRRNVDEPLEADVVLIDETSMVDLRLFVALLRALPKRCRLVLVGDANQLPSVGAGRVYRDLLIAELIPTVTLTVVFRQAHESHIIANAYQVLNGQPLINAPSLDTDALPDFFNIRAQSGAHAAELIEQLVLERIPGRFEIKSRDIQVITPMYRGHCGADQLNRRLQKRLNGSGRPVHKSSPLRVGDRVMQLKNYYDKDVYNGDTGLIITRHEEGAVVDFDGRVVNYTKEHLSMLSLAYACSIHKSQGSEYPAVVIPVLDEHWSMLQRDLLYTALTRGQRLVILVSSDTALERAIRHQVSHWRFTHLHTRLTQE